MTAREGTMTRSTAYDRFPEHRIEIDAERVGLRVRLDGTLLAETSRGLNLREGTYPPVVYVPREDVRMDRLARSDHSTHCPFKGDASYFDFGAGDARVSRVAWSYEDPFDQMTAIRDHLAFYPDRVEIEPLEP
jgi:uncharacterized protein (DUF427 family)